MYQLQSTLQVSRIEAVTRNIDTRFVLNTNTRTVEAWDTKGTSSTADDELIRRSIMPESVSFTDPNDGEAVTIAESQTEPGVYETVFSGNGTVTVGTGEIAVHGGGDMKKLMVTASGGVKVKDTSGKGHGDGELSSKEIRRLE